jgi:predicted glycosyltransferase
MRIWFDLSNSPHINFFYSLIRDLEKEHEIIITCRPLANTIDLLQLFDLPFKVVGRHYGKRLSSKLLGYPIRVLQLYQYLKTRKPDVAISHSSFHSPLVARLLGCRSIYLNDNEHAVGNVPAFLAANTIMIPEFLEKERVLKQGASDDKILQYPGVKEGIYLWQLESQIKGLRSSSSDSEKKIVVVRPEPWTAQYYKGALNFMDSLLEGLKDKIKVLVIPRGEAQAEHYRKTTFSGLDVLDKPLELMEIANRCCMFIGAGGTLTREMAVLGIPTISVYQDELLDVDKYLIKTGQMIHHPDLDASFALGYLEDCMLKSANKELLRKGQLAYAMIKAELLGNLN